MAGSEGIIPWDEKGAHVAVPCGCCQIYSCIVIAVTTGKGRGKNGYNYVCMYVLNKTPIGMSPLTGAVRKIK